MTDSRLAEPLTRSVAGKAEPVNVPPASVTVRVGSSCPTNIAVPVNCERVGEVVVEKVTAAEPVPSVWTRLPEPSRTGSATPLFIQKSGTWAGRLLKSTTRVLEAVTSLLSTLMSK